MTAKKKTLTSSTPMEMRLATSSFRTPPARLTKPASFHGPGSLLALVPLAKRMDAEGKVRSGGELLVIPSIATSVRCLSLSLIDILPNPVLTASLVVTLTSAGVTTVCLCKRIN